MNITPARLPGIFIIEPLLHRDDRGWFCESYREDFIHEAFPSIRFVQDNHVASSYGVVRGLHFQKRPYAQAKLVRVLQGTICDVVVDVRKKSPTYGQSESFELCAASKRQLFVDEGFAHGYSVLSESAEILYKCSNYYHPECEQGICWNDKTMAIDWQILEQNIVVSDRDNRLPTWEQLTPFS